LPEMFFWGSDRSRPPHPRWARLQISANHVAGVRAPTMPRGPTIPHGWLFVVDRSSFREAFRSAPFANCAPEARFHGNKAPLDLHSALAPFRFVFSAHDRPRRPPGRLVGQTLGIHAASRSNARLREAPAGVRLVFFRPASQLRPPTTNGPSFPLRGGPPLCAPSIGFAQRCLRSAKRLRHIRGASGMSDRDEPRSPDQPDDHAVPSPRGRICRLPFGHAGLRAPSRPCP